MKAEPLWVLLAIMFSALQYQFQHYFIAKSQIRICHGHVLGRTLLSLTKRRYLLVKSYSILRCLYFRPTQTKFHATSGFGKSTFLYFGHSIEQEIQNYIPIYTTYITYVGNYTQRYLYKIQSIPYFLYFGHFGFVFLPKHNQVAKMTILQ